MTEATAMRKKRGTKKSATKAKVKDLPAKVVTAANGGTQLFDVKGGAKDSKHAGEIDVLSRR
jgi:hypothetical protein